MTTKQETLAEKLRTINGTAGAKPCPFRRVLNEIDDEETVSLIEGMLRDRTMSTFQVFATLRKSGYNVGRGSTYEHANEQCTCERETV